MTEDKDKEIQKLQAYREAIHQMASHRFESIDDYIMIAKQAVYDYEMGNPHTYAKRKRHEQTKKYDGN